jgi:hypothetical protein
LQDGTVTDSSAAFRSSTSDPSSDAGPRLISGAASVPDTGPQAAPPDAIISAVNANAVDLMTLLPNDR